MTVPDSVDPVAQILGQDAQRLDQCGAVGNPEAAAIEVGEQPLVRVEGVAARQLQPVDEAPVLGADGGAARVRGIDVKPDVLAAADLADGTHGIHGAGRRRADGGADHRGHGPGGAIRGDRRLQRIDAHRIPLVGVDEPQVVAPEARNLHPLLDRGVGVARGVNGEPLPRSARWAVADATFIGRAGARALARGDERGQRAARRTVLNDAAAGRARAEALRQPEQVDQPVEHVGLELGAGGLVAQSMPCTPNPEESRSPRIEGPEALAGKNA